MIIFPILKRIRLSHLIKKELHKGQLHEKYTIETLSIEFKIILCIIVGDIFNHTR